MLLEKKKLKVENFKVKNIYFLCHTLTNLKTKPGNGKSTFQTTSKTIFTNLNSYFDINVNALINNGNWWNYFYVFDWKIYKYVVAKDV